MSSIAASDAILELARSLRADPAQFSLTVTSASFSVADSSHVRIDGPSRNTGGTNTTLHIDASSSTAPSLSKGEANAEIARAVEEWAKGLEAIADEARTTSPSPSRIRQMLDELVVKKLPMVVANATLLMLGGVIAG